MAKFKSEVTVSENKKIKIEFQSTHYIIDLNPTSESIFIIKETITPYEPIRIVPIRPGIIVVE